MRKRTKNQKRQLILQLSLLLIVGFLSTSLVSYFISRASLRGQIASTALPLTSDTVYSEIQRDLLRPILISSVMANDAFLRDWALNGEKDEDLIAKYLKEIMEKYGMFTSFFVSEATRTYYHADGILKRVRPNEERDAWYFRVREMDSDYEINVDPDMANKDTMTIFINHRVLDYHGNFIGATGVGLTSDFVTALIESYRLKYGRNIYFVGDDGTVMLRGTAESDDAGHIRDMDGISALADEILSMEGTALSYSKAGKTFLLNTRYIPELKWYLLVEQAEEPVIEGIHSALILNIVLCALITAVAILLTTLTINVYEHIQGAQQEEIVAQHQELVVKNTQLEGALAEVRKLSGLLPICASCKKIRDDKGYWQRIESYVQEHSEAEFTHGICPECARDLYPELVVRFIVKGIYRLSYVFSI